MSAIKTLAKLEEVIRSIGSSYRKIFFNSKSPIAIELDTLLTSKSFETRNSSLQYTTYENIILGGVTFDTVVIEKMSNDSMEPHENEVVLDQHRYFTLANCLINLDTGEVNHRRVRCSQKRVL